MILTRKLRSFVVCVFVVVCHCGGSGVIAEGSGSDDDNQQQQRYSWRDNSTEMLLNRCRRDCAIYRNVMSCGKFKALQWIDNAVKEKEYVYGPLKIIKLPASAASGERFLPPVPRSKKPSLMSETMYFLRESAEELLTRRALVYTVEQPQGARSLSSSGIMVLDEEELGQMQRARTFDVTFTADGKNRLFHKKKKSIILPILILLNLLKLKLILLPIFFGVHFIKKLLVLGSLLLPSPTVRRTPGITETTWPRPRAATAPATIPTTSTIRSIITFKITTSRRGDSNRQTHRRSSVSL
ncbi:unnamed protein product [Trichogramma brassicae]|uniref:Uncharacterized protein n=1 Tax=Trichogramma brassicae TaxID=86971 RepID=A0A6H5I1U0_9HYME|nr:unnamed protein product [Trichogramma brassicae]